MQERNSECGTVSGQMAWISYTGMLAGSCKDKKPVKQATTPSTPPGTTSFQAVRNRMD